MFLQKSSRPLVELFRDNKVRLTPDKYYLIVSESGTETITQSAITRSKLTKETIEQGVKYVQS